MRLEAVLENLLAQTPGACSAILADWEGEAVIFVSRNGQSEYEIRVIGAHQGILLDRARQLLQKTGLGEPRRLFFVQDRFQILTAPVNRNYYLVLTLSRKSLPALAQTALQHALTELKKEIE